MTPIPTALRLLPCLLPCLLAGPVQAGLTIQTFGAGALADVVTSVGTQHATLFDDQPYALPFVLTATAQVGTQTALAQQAKNGYFQNRAAAAFGNEPNVDVVANAYTTYSLTVGTDTADTPLILDFNVFGSLARGSAYYAAGEVIVRSGLSILAGGVPVWGYRDTASQSASLFSVSHTETDLQGIGLPAATNFVGFDGFQNTGSVDRGGFFGTLDFGLLQPGELFTVIYESASSIYMKDVDYGGSALATLTDPFALGGEPPLTLRGLALPTAPGSVPEPQTWALMLAALALLVRTRAMRGQAYPARPEYLLKPGGLQAYR